MPKSKIAIDLDDTLGRAFIHELNNEVLGFQIRPYGIDLLELLQPKYDICIWTISSRWYLDKVLKYGLGKHFTETYSSDELPGAWKDIRTINATYLIDDNPYHQESAKSNGLSGDHYIIVPAYGSPEDEADPELWARMVKQVLLPSIDL